MTPSLHSALQELTRFLPPLIRQLIGSRQVALEVVRLLREVVASAKFNSFEQLIGHIEEVGKVLQDAGPKGKALLSSPTGSHGVAFDLQGRC